MTPNSAFERTRSQLFSFGALRENHNGGSNAA
jgi:hypothetical protein